MPYRSGPSSFTRYVFQDAYITHCQGLFKLLADWVRSVFLQLLAGISTIAEIGQCNGFFSVSNNTYRVEGACVLEEDKDIFIAESRQMEIEREAREKKKMEERALKNWKKFIQGVVRLHRVKTRFGHPVEEQSKVSNRRIGY